MYNGNVIDEATVIVKGDVNGDGKVTAADYLKIRRYCCKTLELNDSEFLAADVDDNEIVGISDY